MAAGATAATQAEPGREPGVQQAERPRGQSQQKAPRELRILARILALTKSPTEQRA